jgi:hypothetical protein
MRIEALESIKSDGWVLVQGDSVQVPDEVGRRWCVAGWAQDASGQVPTGERRGLNARLDVEPLAHKQRAREV